MVAKRVALRRLTVLGAVLVLGTVLAFPVSGASGLLLDRVDIGDATSEADNVLVGWGPVEPTTHGGGWGGIAGETPPGTTRVIWYSDLDGSQVGGWICTPDDAVADGSAATLDLIKPARTAAKTLAFRHLDGFGDDSFEVWVKNPADGQSVLVFTWVDAGGSFPTWGTAEVWIESTASLDGLVAQGGPSRTYEVTFLSTASAWMGWCPYGQLAIDWIELRGDGRP